MNKEELIKDINRSIKSLCKEIKQIKASSVTNKRLIIRYLDEIITLIKYRTKILKR